MAALKESSLTRRNFLRQTALTTTALWLGSQVSRAKISSPSNRLNIGIIGTANRAQANIAGVSSENIVALCDIDDHYLSAAAERFPRAKTYNDFRKLLERKDIDAVVVSTADHTHAVATIGALQSGRHVYCEKPLAHTVSEARLVSKIAAHHPHLATQMGTQIHAGKNYRRVVELVQCGAIGNVTECHVWCDKSWGGEGRPVGRPPVPAYLHWDLWLGPAPERAYNPDYLPKNWRRWWDFGNGTLGDMGCHYMDLAHWALDLHHPLTVEAEGPELNPDTTPAWLIVRYQYESRASKSPIDVTWYDGGKRPELLARGKIFNWKNGVLFVGDKGMLLADYEHHHLLPESDFRGFAPPPPTIPDSIGHHKEWIQACKTGSPTTCNFGYSGALSEAVLLGNVAYRAGRKLEWDSLSLNAKNCREASNYIQREPRRGWII
ncbi:MAG TPA: Gfo/Idh/MocA family oxidoreductase [Verrucomicrobiae bacterium]|nr:Gfo/Idh/MocA family oxidoreductase [Verrucomicrobiae bacterium]